MRNKQIFLKPCMALLLFFVLSILVIGCESKSKINNQVDIVGDKQLTENNITYDSKESAVKVTAPEMNTYRTATIKDQIQMDQWRQLIGDLKSTLGDIKESAEQSR